MSNVCAMQGMMVGRLIRLHCDMPTSCMSDCSQRLRLSVEDNEMCLPQTVPFSSHGPVTTLAVRTSNTAFDAA